MNTFKIGEIEYQIASSYNELSRQQMEGYVKLVYKDIPKIFALVEGKTKIINPQLLEEKYMTLLVILLNFNLKLAAQLNVEQELKDDDGKPMLYDDGSVMMYSNAHFLIFTNQVCNFFFETLPTKNFLPRIKIGEKKYLYGPADNFKNLRIEEYFYADKLYLAYRDSGKEDFLNRLVATLYRPAKKGYKISADTFDGDKREVFNEHLLLGRTSLVKALNFDTKYLVYIWYEACRNQMVRDYPLLYSGNNENTYVLKPEEELVTLCGGWEKYPKNKHAKLRLLFNDLHAAIKKDMSKKLKK